MGRWINFLIAISIGIVAGVLYASRLDRVEFVNTTPQSLRVDYKTDYVLMVAEAYSSEKDLELARQRLSALGSGPLDQIVLDALLFAEPRYQLADITLIRALLRDLQTMPTASPTIESIEQ